MTIEVVLFVLFGRRLFAVAARHPPFDVHFFLWRALCSINISVYLSTGTCRPTMIQDIYQSVGDVYNNPKIYIPAFVYGGHCIISPLKCSVPPFASLGIPLFPRRRADSGHSSTAVCDSPFVIWQKNTFIIHQKVGDECNQNKSSSLVWSHCPSRALRSVYMRILYIYGMV